MPFVQATREKSRLRLGLTGHEKTGKSRTSLIIATGLQEFLSHHGELTGNGRIAVIDTEHMSSKKYAMAHKKDVRSDAYDFDVLYLEPPYSPEAYIKAVKEAKKAGYPILIIDQISHEWDGQGGCLSIHADLVTASSHKNGYILFREVMKRHQAFVEEYLAYPGHIICTMRAKVKHKMDKESKTITKLGYKAIAKEGTGFEFDGIGMLDMKHTLRMEGSRCPFLDNSVFLRPDKDLAQGIGEWLLLGVTTTEVARARLDAYKVSRIKKLFAKLGYSEDDILANLTERGFSDIEDLHENVADEMISNMERYIEDEERKKKRAERRAEQEAQVAKVAKKAPQPSSSASSVSSAKPMNGKPVSSGPIGNLTPDQMRDQVGDMLEGKDPVDPPPGLVSPEVQEKLLLRGKISAPFTEDQPPSPLRKAPEKKPVSKKPKNK